MVMVTHQMLGEAVLHSFKGSSYNSKKISLIDHSIYSSTKRNISFKVLLTSQSIIVYTVSLSTKNIQKGDWGCWKFCMSLYLLQPHRRVKTGFSCIHKNKPFSVSTLFGAGTVSFSCRWGCNQVYNWF